MSKRYKYPRTRHLPWSPGASEDDLHLQSLTDFHDTDIVVTEKMDGENTSLYADHLHARSLDSRHHSSRDWLKQWHGSMAHNIPFGWRVCGENLFARHSIAYQQLASYFYGFSIWNEHNESCSWDTTVEWFELLGIEPVPVLYRGPWDEKLLRSLALDTERQEGYVVRTSAAFGYSDFSAHVAKWVRSEHVQTENHWMHSAVVPNGLKRSDEQS